MKRTYLDGCSWCQATGIVHSRGLSTTNVFDNCPVCNGSKVITITEETEEITTNDPKFAIKFDPSVMTGTSFIGNGEK
jgi:hypothetical protein